VVIPRGSQAQKRGTTADRAGGGPTGQHPERTRGRGRRAETGRTKTALSHHAITVPNVEIRVARLTGSSPEVVEQINVLIPQLKPAWDRVSIASLDGLIESPTRVYVARCEGVVRGITLLVPHRHLPGLRFHVEDVVVDKRFRRLGIARKMLTTAMADASEDVVSFDLRSHAVRPGAHELYRGLGFEPSDTTVFRRALPRPNST